MTRRGWLGAAALGALGVVAVVSLRADGVAGLAVLCAGLAFLAVAGAALPDQARLAVLAGSGAISWFLADWWPALLWVHRPLLAAAALSFPHGRLPHRSARIEVALLAVAAALPSLARSPQVTLALSAGLAACARRELQDSRRERPGLGTRREGRTRAGAASLLAVALAVPAAVRWIDPFGPDVVMAPAIARGLEVVYCTLVAVSGTVLLLPLLRGVAQGAVDSAVQMSAAGTEDVLAQLRQAPQSREASATRARESAIALLEDNVARRDELERAVEAVRISRLRLVEATEAERRTLRRVLAERALPTVVNVDRLLSEIDGGQQASVLRQCRGEVAAIGADLDRLAQGLHPGDLQRDGLAGLHSAIASSPIPVSIAVPSERLPQKAEEAAWYACTEAISNAVKHARATRVAVEVSARGDAVVGTVTDDGTGGATIEPGGGLGGLRDRLEAVGGWMTVTSPGGHGTTLRFAVPLP